MIYLLRYWKLLAGVALAGLLAMLFAFTFRAGVESESNRRAAAELQVQARAYERLNKEIARGNRLAADLTIAQQKRRVVTKTIIKEVPKYVTPEHDAACIVPDDFVGLWNDAAQGNLPAGSGRTADPS